MIYENKRNGMKATLIRENTGKDGDGTYVLQYEDGKVNSVTASTFKRWWKKSDIQPVEEVQREAKRAVRHNQDERESYHNIITQVIQNKELISIKSYKKIPNFIKVLYKGNTIFEIRLSRIKFKLCFKGEDIVNITDILDNAGFVYNHKKYSSGYAKPEVIEITDNIDKVIDLAINAILDKNIKESEEKKDGEV